MGSYFYFNHVKAFSKINIFLLRYKMVKNKTSKILMNAVLSILDFLSYIQRLYYNVLAYINALRPEFDAH